MGNHLYGEAGDDTIRGGKGNDTLDGGAGNDMAVFSGQRSAYVVSYDQTTQRYQISSAVEGIDTVSNVERFSFADGIVDAAQFGNNTFTGLAYHWKSHALLPGVTVTGLDPKSVQADTADRFDLRAATLNTVNNTLSVELWMNNATQSVANFDFTSQTTGAVAASFVSAVDSADWNLNINTANPDRVVVAGFMKNASEGVSGSVKLGTLQLSLSSGAVPMVSFTDLAIGELSLPDVQFSSNWSTTSATGRFTLNSPAYGEHMLAAHRSVSDETFKGGITASDALAALMIAVELNPNPDADGTGPKQALKVSPYQVIAADVNQDGKVSSIDALTILKMAVGLSDAPALGWIFVPEGRDFWNEAKGQFLLDRTHAAWDPKIVVPASQTQSNLVGVIRGDVNGSWSLAGAGTVEAIDPSHFQELAALLGVPLDQWGIG